jgi:hypothetical protein
MNNKNEVARRLADAYRQVEPSIVSIVRIEGPSEESPAEPVKLLEVNPDTPPAGIVPVSFGSDGQVPFASIVVEVTPEEFEMLQRHQLELPTGWRLGETLYLATGEVADGSP